MVHCFYHNDQDGHCAGAIVKMKYPDAVMHEINYGYDLKKDVLDKLGYEGGKQIEDVEIYIVDFSFKRADTDLLIDLYAEPMTILDHHQSALEQIGDMVPGDVAGIIDTSKAGAQLTWEYLYPDKPLPLAVYYVSKWDIWDHSDPRTIPFCRGLQLTESTDPANEQAMIMWKELFDNNREGDNRRWNALDQVMNLGVIGEAMKAQYDFKIAKNAYYIPDWNGYRTVALNSYVLDSYCIFEYSHKWEELDPQVLVWYYQCPDGKWLHSIRSYPGTDTDVKVIAEQFGGGGHIGAAGCKTDECLVFPIKETDNAGA